MSAESTASIPRGGGTASGSTSGPPAVSLNAWIRIAPDGAVVVAVPRVEMGQGIHTALALLAAEELDIDWRQVQVETVWSGRVYANTALLSGVLPLQEDEKGWWAQAARWTTEQMAWMVSLNVTGGSASVRSAWESLRWAGAGARSCLVEAAARQGGVAPESLVVRSGAVHHPPTGRQWSFAALAQQWSIRPTPPERVAPPKPRGAWKLIGTSPPRLDTPAKLNGQAAFGMDIPIPGRWVAALVMAPHAGAHWRSFDDAQARQLPGVRHIVPCPDWPVPCIAVIADGTWQALRAARQVTVDWSQEDSGFGDHRSAQTVLREALNEDGVRFRQDGNPAARWAQAATADRWEAEYTVPYLAHAPLEPLNACVRVESGAVDIWCGTQSPILARWRAAQLADVPIDAVRLHIPYLGGGFGRRLEVDVVDQATRLALKFPGTPIQVVWSREQDLQHDVYRPAAAARLAASWKGDRLDSVSIRVAAPSVSHASMQRWLPPWMGDAVPRTPDKVQIEGAYDLPYDIGHVEVRQILTDSPLPVGSWRSVGHSYNAFFTECFLDELALQRERDPFELRRDLLRHRPRHRAVLDALERLCDWKRPPAEGISRGLALHGSFGSICGQVAEVERGPRGWVVHRIYCVLDAGTIVHPDGVRAQLEGSIVFGLSAALWGQVPFQGRTVQLRAWSDYPVVRMEHCPEIVMHLMDSTAAPGGVGEPGTPPVAPAVANALSRLEGQRRRSLPLTPIMS